MKNFNKIFYFLVLSVLFSVSLPIAYAATPVITSISPTYTYNSDNFIGDAVNVNGTDFPSVPVVFLDGNVDTIGHGVYTSTTTSFNVKATTSPGVHTIEIGDWLNPSAPHSNKFNLTVKDNNMRPVGISDIVTSDGAPIYTDSAKEIHVYGSFIFSDEYVLLDGNKISTTFVSSPAVSGSSWGDYLKFNIPSGSTAGAHTVQVGGQNGLRELSNIKTLIFFAPSTGGGGTGGAGVPVIDSFSLGLVLTGGQVTVLGPDKVVNPFDCRSLVMVIDGKTVSNASSDCWPGRQDTGYFYRGRASYIVPTTLTEGSHAFQVKDINGTLSNTLNLEVAVPPTVSYSSPYSVAPGDTVTVYGTKFSDKTMVCSGFAPGGIIKTEPVTSYTATTLTFKIPTNARFGALAASVYNSDSRIATLWPNVGGICAGIPATGNVPVSIVSSVGSGAPQAPTIISLTPTTTTPGGSVTITGSGFDANAVVVIDSSVRLGLNGGPLTVIPTTRSATSITFIVPQASVYQGITVFAGLSNGAHAVQVLTGAVAMTPSVYSNPMTLTISGSTTTSSVLNNTSNTNTSNTSNISQVPNTNTQPGCSDGNLYNPQTGQPCVNNAGSLNQGGSVSSGGYNFGNVTLFKGSRGDAVKELQRFFNEKFNLGLVEDGKFGKKTDAQVRQWQRDHGLTVDGRVGAKTKAKMNAE